MRYLLGIDQGTTSTRAVIFNEQGSIVSSAQKEFKQYYPQDGWVEHDPEDIWDSVLSTCHQVIRESGLEAKQIAGIGISNQRETTVVWDRETSKPIYNAIVWQDRRTAEFCEQKKSHEAYETMVQYKTGLLLDPYFSATKIAWILDHVEGAREKAAAGKLAFGTIDSFILWRLTAGREHKTDATNAARTLIFNIRTQSWDDELLELFNIPKTLLPQVFDNSAYFGVTNLFDHEIPITGMAGDQQAALIGQACFSEGMVKSTYGTGCFIVMNTGDKLIESKNRLISTVAYRLNGKTTYAIEGSIFVAGASIKWLRDTLHLITDTKQTETLALQAKHNSGVYLVPAFTGLGAPYWDPYARGAILGLTRDSGIAEIVRAALEAVCYQTKDLIDLFGVKISTLRVDGGMVVNDWLVQFLSDILNVPVERPVINETSVLGAVYLAGLQLGVFKSLEDISHLWALQKQFKPNMEDAQRQAFYSGWVEAVGRVTS